MKTAPSVYGFVVGLLGGSMLSAGALAADHAPSGFWECQAATEGHEREDGGWAAAHSFTRRFRFATNSDQQADENRAASDAHQTTPLQKAGSKFRWHEEVNDGYYYEARFRKNTLSGSFFADADYKKRHGRFQCLQGAADTWTLGDSAPQTLEQALTPHSKAVLGDTASAVDKKPRPVLTTAPVYPSEALEQGIIGRVVICFRVERDGLPGDAVIVDSSNEIFDAPSLAALSSSRFHPATKDGQAVQSSACRTYKFWFE